MKKILYIPLLILLSCGSTPPVSSVGQSFTPRPMGVTYQASYDYAWQAALQEMQRFPLRVVNKNAGTIVTSPKPVVTNRHKHRIMEYIDLKLKRLPDSNGIPQTRIEISKFAKTDPAIGRSNPVPSDLIDEKVIHHRIKRLLEIERKKLDRNLN